MTRTSGHTLIIGAGMGGLAAAMRLASAGEQVTVIEAADAPGGKVRTVPSAAGPVDAGPTVLTMKPWFDDLFVSCGARLSDHATLVRETILARHFWPDGSTLDLHDDREESAAAVRAFAGQTAERQFRAFAKTTAALFDAFDAPLMRNPSPSRVAIAAQVARRPNLIGAIGTLRSMARKLAQEFDDPRLRQLFGRYATYVGGSPYEAPAVLRLVAEAEALGVWRVEGGMHRLAVAMAEVARSRGADVRYGKRAESIETDGSAVNGVRLSDGSTVTADRIVFNGDPRALREGLLGEDVRHAVGRSAVEPRSLSADVWTFAALAEGADLARHNVFFGSDPRREFDPISAGKPPIDPTIYVCAQDRGDGLAPPVGVERFEIIVNAPPLPANHSEDVATCRTRTFLALAERGLTFHPVPEDTSLTRPAQFAEMFPGSQGSLYGRSPHGALAAFARPTARTKIGGLYLAGGGAHPGAGVPMAALSGRHAAEAILTDRTSTSTSRRTATRGGTSMASATMAPAPSRSSPS